MLNNKERYEQCYANDMMAVRKVLSEYESDWEVVDDLAQETFVAAWESLDSFNGNSEFLTWVCQIAKNVAGKAIEARQAQKRPELVGAVVLETADTLGEIVPYYDRPFTDEVEAQQEALDPAVQVEADDYVEQIVGAMPPQMGRVTELRAAGHTNPEIAALIGTSVSTVENQISRAGHIFAQLGENSARNRTNSVCEGDQKRLSVDELRDLIDSRFLKRDRAVAMRLARIAEAREMAPEEWTLSNSCVGG